MTLIYTLTIFVSAFLLFLIQPMISKLMLPQLGGSPAVWNTAMMFFQVFLLLGYLYTHFSSKWLGVKKQSLLHVGLLLASLAWLPIALHTDIDFSSSEQPIFWVITSLFFSVGVPFFMLASNAPLIQMWLANTTHKHAHNPYFLYSASNVGSLLALLAYPFVIERLFTLSGQTQSWSYLFILFAVLVSGCAWLMRRHFKSSDIPHADSALPQAAPSARTKCYWIALAFAPSSLMLGLTSYITTDIASMPLFWVIPLALYLVTFIFAFGSRQQGITGFAVKAQNILVPLTVWTLIFHTPYVYAGMALHVITFFATAMVCHGALAAHKPSTKYLTEYFVWISFGGMLGGVFNSLVAPNLFTNPIEYVLVFMLALFLRPKQPGHATTARANWLDVGVPVLFVGLTAALFKLLQMFNAEFRDLLISDNAIMGLGSDTPVLGYSHFISMVVLYIFIMVMVDITKHRPARFALSIFFLLLVGNRQAFNPTMQDALYAERNFFGVTSVSEGRYFDEFGARIMMHGTTTHGVQSLNPEYRLKPVSYYAPLPDILRFVDPVARHRPYAVMGLGSGTSACVGKKNQQVDFYEIDPAVVSMAGNPKLFTYLSDCPTAKTIILGDGRLKIAKAEDQKYSLIVMDAFTSDAIPMHLLTREALAIYKQKIARNGLIAFHISNRYVDLSGLVAGLAQEAKLHSILLDDTNNDGLRYSSRWVILTEDPGYFKRLSEARLQGIELYDMNDYDSSHISLWTDNYSNILQILY